MKNIFLVVVVYAIGFTNCANVQTNSEPASNKEVQTKEMTTKPHSNTGVETSQTTSDSNSDLNVSIDYWEKQRNKALETRKSPVGSDVKGVTIPEELVGIGDKSKTKLEEMRSQNFDVPMDFFDLAKKNLNKELVELPIATEIYVLDVGGNADKKEFTAFNFKDGATVPEENSDGQRKLKELAGNFNLELNDPSSRWLIRLKLLRMLNPKAKMILEQIAEQYQAKFNRPLLVNALVQPIDYSIEMNKVDAGSFKVRENGGIPPHCTGMSFDLSIKKLTAEEQNFISNILTEMDKTGKVDAQYTTGPNSAFHIFVL